MNKIKPNDVEVELWQWFGTDFSKEFERVAKNIILILSENYDDWREISWQEYRKFLEQTNKEVIWEDEVEALKEMVEEGFLDYKSGQFIVNNSFLEMITEFGRF